MHFDGEAYWLRHALGKQLLKLELRAISNALQHALVDLLGPAAWRASRNHVLMILTSGCEWTPADGLPAPRYDYGEMMDYGLWRSPRIIEVAMDEDPSDN